MVLTDLRLWTLLRRHC